MPNPLPALRTAVPRFGTVVLCFGTAIPDSRIVKPAPVTVVPWCKTWFPCCGTLFPKHRNVFPDFSLKLPKSSCAILHSWNTILRRGENRAGLQDNGRSQITRGVGVEAFAGVWQKFLGDDLARGTEGARVMPTVAEV